MLIISWFRASGYAYGFVWAISVTHEGCLYTDVRLQEKYKQWTWQPRSTSTNLSAVIYL